MLLLLLSLRARKGEAISKFRHEIASSAYGLLAMTHVVRKLKLTDALCQMTNIICLK